MQKNIHEILEEVGVAKTKEEKIKILQKNNSLLLSTILFYTFDKKTQFFTTEFPLGYKENDSPIGMGMANLHQEFKKLSYFILHHAHAKGLTDSKKINMLAAFLESLEAKEARVIIRMFRKNLDINGLNEALVREAFPKLLG